jgi:hypothetical protein
MSQIGVETLSLTERKADFFWVLYEKKRDKGIQSEDKLDAVNNDYKRTEETA